MTMLSYHNNPGIKAAILRQLSMHREADQLVKGQYWEGGKGCAIGCTLHSGMHMEYETRFGIPVVLARLEDRLFEGLPNKKSQEWPERFMGAIGVGRDLTMVWPRFALWLLTVELGPIGKKYPKSGAALAEVGALYREWCEGVKPDRERWIGARNNADAAITAAVAAYGAIAAAAAIADAAYAAAYAYADAYDAIAAAAGAITARAIAAYAYADAYDAGAAAAAAYADARSRSYIRQSDKLIEILEAA